MECAILFDSGFIDRVHIDKVVCVTAPLAERVQRIVQRDHITPEKAQEWIDRQMPQDEVLKRSHYEIVNDGKCDIDAQIQEIIEEISETNK